jgi:menaquinol-cytochrome c reductase cytochrome b subunit
MPDMPRRPDLTPMTTEVPSPQIPTVPGGGLPPGGVAVPPAVRRGWWGGISEQLGLDTLMASLVRNYLIPVETNSIWYVIGGVLAIALAFEILTGVILLFPYRPDAAFAWQSTRDLLASRGWSIILNFHYYNSYLIFGLVMVHFMRVFISGAYRAAKKGLWQVGVALAALVFAISITGETLHWDERGFAVPWHIGEFLEALRLQYVFNFVHKDLLNVDFATPKLLGIYALHIVVLPAILVLVIALHYYLIKLKGISLPFWHKASGRMGPFSEHIRAWTIYGGIALAVILILSIVWQRDAGPAPQNLPISPYYHAKEGPGGLGITPTFPISWTHGMNRFVSIAFGLEPDIWGTVIAMIIMLGTLVLVPYVDRVRTPLGSWGEAFSLRTRGLAFLLVILFWATMIVGIVTNAVTPVG